MELKNTITAMVDSDYKARFAAEYWQTKIRYDKLHNMLVSYDAETLDFKPTCDINLLRHQASMMGRYLYDLEVRAKIEDIDLKLWYTEMKKYEVSIVKNENFYTPEYTQKNLEFEAINFYRRNKLNEKE